MNSKNTINTMHNTNNQIKNFSTLNFKEVDIGGGKNAWMFLTVNLKEDYGQLGSREYPSYFYVRTETGNIYMVFKKESRHLQELVKDGQKCQYIIDNCHAEWCTYNVSNREIVGMDNHLIRLGEPFLYARGHYASDIKEIIGVSESKGMSTQNSLKSRIEQEFIEKNAK